MDKRSGCTDEQWAQVARAIRLCAGRAGLDYNDAEDCLADYCRRELSHGRFGRHAKAAAGDRLMLVRSVHWFVRDWIYRRKRNNSATRSLQELTETWRERPEIEPVAPGSDPLENAIAASWWEDVARVVEQFPERQQYLWKKIILEGERVPDVSKETGRSVSAIQFDLHKMRHVLRKAFCEE